jgi:molecular chaperone GrpE
MSDDEQQLPPEATQPEATQPEATSEITREASAESLEARLAELERQLASERDAATDYMQRWQRAVADFTNYKRRAQQDHEQHERLLAAQALLPVLNALDSFEWAFAALPDSLRGFTWIEGIALVEYQLRHALEAQGISEVAAEAGQPFDPIHHQAVGEIATDEHPAGHIAAVLQRGYQTASVLMRPALVQVARPPDASDAAEPSEAAEQADRAAHESAGESGETAEETQPSGPAP